MISLHPRHLWALPFELALGALLRDVLAGELTVTMPDGRTHDFAGARLGPVASLEVIDESAARRIALGGDVGLAEGYLLGAWDTPDLKAVLDFGLANMSAGWLGETPFLRRPLERLRHARRDNDPEGGSKRNIAHHYDLGNDFYELWLDDTMTYSAAVFDGGGNGDAAARGRDADLPSAQRAKWDRLLELIQPSSRDHLLEIGCGWGGFALHAAQEIGCRVTGLTLSEEQARFARDRAEQLGLDDRVDIRLEDYRQVSGQFSRVVSIEMFEAVGERWWPTYFGRLKELLADCGTAAIQTITIADDRFESYRDNPDFIQRYIFPGGMLPSPERFAASAQAAGLATGTPHFFGADYSRTLELWTERFEAATDAVRALGFDERFIRMWRYYLTYCRTGFDAGAIDVMQVRLEG